MKAHLFIAILASLAIFSCEDFNSGKNSVTFLVSETEAGKTLTTSEKEPSIIPLKGQSYIIIQDVDTAMVVLYEDGNKTPLCDAFYHDPKAPWVAGKTMVALKGNMVYLFTLVQDGEALRLSKTLLSKDSAVNFANNADGSFDVRGLKTVDGTTHDFNSNE
jgi:hypothetical protein